MTETTVMLLLLAVRRKRKQVVWTPNFFVTGRSPGLGYGLESVSECEAI
jgi:hypothetical protein